MKNLLVVFVMFITANLFGQLDFNNINLNDYKNPDYKYKSLYLYFDLSGRGDISILSTDNDDKTSGNGRTGLNLNTNWRVIKNSRKKQLSSFTRISIAPNIYLRKQINNDVTDKISFPVYLANDTKQKYYIIKKTFFETDIFLSSDNRIATDLEGEEGTFYSKSQLTLPLMIGFGRIENITGAWHAFRIAEDLQKDGVLKNDANFSEEDIRNLADLITERKFTRSFDYRNKLKDDIVSLRNSILRDKVDFNNPLAYASIFDIWQNGINTQRRSGFTFALGVEPGFNLYYSNDGQTSYNTKAMHLFLITRFDYARALSKKWQLDFTLDLKGGAYDVLYSNSQFHDDLTDNLKPAANTSLRFSIGYFPNTRTYFRSGINLGGTISSPNPDSDKINVHQYFSLTNNLYYYINSRHRLFFHLNVGDRLNYHNRYDIYETETHFNFDYGVGYSLAIF